MSLISSTEWMCFIHLGNVDTVNINKEDWKSSLRSERTLERNWSYLVWGSEGAPWLCLTVFRARKRKRDSPYSMGCQGVELALPY